MPTAPCPECRRGLDDNGDCPSCEYRAEPPPEDDSTDPDDVRAAMARAKEARRKLAEERKAQGHDLKPKTTMPSVGR